MSLLIRMLIPVLLLALVGLGACAVISFSALDMLGQSRSNAEMATKLSAAVNRVVAQTEVSDAELDRVIQMSTLFDTDASWAAVQMALDDIAAQTALIDSLPVSPAMTTLNDQIKAVAAKYRLEAAMIYGKEASPEIPTAEMINRSASQMKAVSNQMLYQLRVDAASFALRSNVQFTRQINSLVAAALVISLLVVAGSILMVRRTSRQIRVVAADLARSAGDSGGAAGRDEIRNLEKAARAFALRAAALAIFQTDLSRTVDSAVDGDFSRRLQIDAPEADLQQIARRMNELMESVEGALAETSDVLMRIARGELSARINGDYRGVLQNLKRDTNATGEQLYRIVTDIDAATRTINANMKQIVGGSNALSARTRQQVSSLESLAGAMADLTQTSRAATDSVAQARSVSDDATTRATEGDRVAEEATAAILQVQNSAEKISEVTVVVEGLAFQTSILAINAAVEAARAGESGKGFAIVAQEVRSLAIRSSEAAKMIAAQTAESVAQIGIGAEKVRATREVLRRIKAGIEGMHDAMRNIDSASRSQLTSFLDVAGTIADLNRETQMNANLAHDSVVAASDVEAHANRLQEQMAVFRLDERPKDTLRQAAAWKPQSFAAE